MRCLEVALLFCVCLPVSAMADGKKEQKENAWSDYYVSAGLQMWRPMFAVGDATAVEATDKAVIGGVIKVQTNLTEVMGLHLRGTYGMHKHDLGNRKSEGDAWATGLGMDFYYAINDKVMWSNTFGLAYGQSKAEANGIEGPTLKSLGAYFITTFDVTVAGPMGIWMDWGCQVVGPSFATYGGQDLSLWHINPLGAGGMRISF
ncbi:MAG: hypothetical protein VX589_13710 [Myxococcota bacterium]|nr:hypothetical protein [Myxococcota bacterium]